MSIDPSKWTPAQWVAAGAAQGLPTLWAVDTKYPWAAIAARNKPGQAPDDFNTVCEGNLRARGLVYFKSNPGDCPSVAKPSLSNADITGLATKVGTTGLAAGLAATGALVGVAAGAATAGLAAIGTVIATIFANHAAAVADEQQTICGVAGLTNGIIPQIDAAVASGKITPTQGIAAMQGYVVQLNAQLSAIEKTCDAACVFQGILNAHADFASTFYPGICPAGVLQAQAPGQPPQTPTPPSAPPSVTGSVTVQGSGGVASVPTAKDAFGNTVPLTNAFFSSAQGTASVGMAGQFFNGPELAQILVDHPDWGLTSSSPISNAQVATIGYQHPDWVIPRSTSQAAPLTSPNLPVSSGSGGGATNVNGAPSSFISGNLPIYLGIIASLVAIAAFFGITKKSVGA
jgi:hypothetical protein